MAVKDESGTAQLNTDEWLKIPMPKRIQFILENKVQFFNGDEIVPTREAVQILKTTL